MRAVRFAILAAVLLGLQAAPAGAVTLQRVGGSATFESPVYVTQPRSGGPLLVVEQGGTIRAVVRGVVRARPFLDIRALVLTGGERGLLSVAFPPDYARSRLLYVYYTNSTGDIEIDEFRRARHSATRAKASSRRRVLTIDHREFGNHNGGQLQFDAAGRLYAGTGDGGGSGDPHGNARNPGSLLGKLLRIDPTRRRGRPYGVPRDNPFVGRPGRNEIYALGLRNPWRFSFDRVGRSQRIAIGDVGQGAQEEIDYETLGGARGADFGWNAFEGFLTYPGGAMASSQPNPPIFAYAHTGGRCSITGGYVVRDPSLPTLTGRYVYADFCDGDLRTLVPSLGGAGGDASLGLHVDSISSFGRDAAGHIYATSLTGPIYRLAP